MLSRSLYKLTDKKALTYNRVLWGLRRGVSNIASGRRADVKLGIHSGMAKGMFSARRCGQDKEGVGRPRSWRVMIWVNYGGPHHMACKILVPQPGTEPSPPGVEVWS